MLLTESEQSYYGELFQTCDVDGTGKFSGGQVTELFRQSGLSSDILMQITELCGAKRLGHFGRSQFYFALKLIAAAQCGLSVSHESINSGVDIPLPKFHKVTPSEHVLHQSQNAAESSLDRPHQGQLPPPPTSAKKQHGRNPSGQFRGLHPEQAPLQIPVPQVKEGQQGDVSSPPFPPNAAAGGQLPVQGPTNIANPQSPPISPQQGPQGPNPMLNQGAPKPSQVSSPAVSAGKPGPGKGLGGKRKPQRGTEEWARFESDDEKHGLLGQGRKEEWDGVKLPDFDSSSYSSDTESVEDVWSINDEQREYYVKQFHTIEHDQNGHISGAVAKDFFEKSKLSNLELSKIWNLADLNRDGALSLEEFCIAMHLVVLRRNEIEIPDRLPFSLMPYNAFTNEDAEPFAVDLPEGSTLKRLSPMSPPESQWDNMVQESPAAISSSEVSSPSVTPANFDFQKPEPSDPEAHIVQPKAVHVQLSSDMNDVEVRPERGRAFSEPVPMAGEGVVVEGDNSSHGLVTKQRSNTTSETQNHVDNTLQSRPRPLAKRHTVPGVMPGHILPPGPMSGHPAGLEHSFSVEATEPPAPPPRPNHIRSMSVDYKAPPAVPPRVTPKDPPGSAKKFSQLKHFEPIQSQEVLNIIPGSDATTTVPSIDPESHRQAQSLDYRQKGHDGDPGSEAKAAVAWDLLGADFVDGSAERQAEFVLAAQRQANRDKKELQMAIRTHKERNSTLSRLNSELNQELQEVMEQRIALEIQLEHLRPFSS